MARKPRIEFEGALYHVITRGNQKQKTFRGAEDYQRYLKILADYKSRYDFLLYGYVLMENHVHLLMETKKVPLSKILQGINQSYTMYFNRRYATVGHLFQGRYKAILCDRDSYLLSLLKYIHMNPIRAGMVKSLEEYRWSSHQCYVGRAGGGGMVSTELVLKMFSDNMKKARRAYRSHMGEELVLRQEEVYATVSQRILGDEGFVQEVMSRSGRRDVSGRRRHAYKLPEIARAVEELEGISLEQLRGKGRGDDERLGRRVMSFVAKEYGYKGQDIAEYLWRDPSVITRYLRGGSKSESRVEKVLTILRANSNKQV